MGTLTVIVNVYKVSKRTCMWSHKNNLQYILMFWDAKHVTIFQHAAMFTPNVS